MWCNDKFPSTKQKINKCKAFLTCLQFKIMVFLKRNVVTKNQCVFLNHKILNFEVFLLFRPLVKKKLTLSVQKKTGVSFNWVKIISQEEK